MKMQLDISGSLKITHSETNHLLPHLILKRRTYTSAWTSILLTVWEMVYLNTLKQMHKILLLCYYRCTQFCTHRGRHNFMALLREKAFHTQNS